MRTKRLIEREAIMESLIDGAKTMTNEGIKALLEISLLPVHIEQKPKNAAVQLEHKEFLAYMARCSLLT